LRKWRKGKKKSNINDDNNDKKLQENEEDEENKGNKFILKQHSLTLSKNFKSSGDLRESNVNYDQNLTPNLDLISNNSSYDSDVEWENEIEPYKIDMNKHKTKSTSSEIIPKGKELSFDHTEDENELSHIMDGSKKEDNIEQQNNENDQNIINENENINNIENLIEYWIVIIHK